MNKKLEIIVEAIEDKKGEEILVLDFEGKNSLFDYAVIATARSDKNVQAVVENIEKKLNEEINEKKLGVEGFREAQWVLMDYTDTMIHIFQREARNYYSLEELWNDAKELMRN